MRNAWLISFIRIPLLFAMLMVFFLLLKLFKIEFSFPFLPDLSTIYFTVVNVICFILLHRILIKEGRSIKELIDFLILNAPIEELMYRGYAQPLFIEKYKKVWIGVIIPSVGFALQHVMLAPSIHGAIVYAVAFFVWGIGSAIIYLKQKRLFPLIICHFIVNIAFSILPIICRGLLNRVIESIEFAQYYSALSILK